MSETIIVEDEVVTVVSVGEQGPPGPGLADTDALPEGDTNLYFTAPRAAAAAPVQSVAGRTGAVVLAKADVGLANVDNTSDNSKPVSTAQAAADASVAATAQTNLTALWVPETVHTPVDLPLRPELATGMIHRWRCD